MYRPTAISMWTLREEEFRLLRDFIHERFGLYFDDNQRASLRSRLLGRLASLDLRSFEDYYHYLRFGPTAPEELARMVSHLTNNETYFYRERPAAPGVRGPRAAADQGAEDAAGDAHAAHPLRGLLHRRGGVHPRHDRVRQRPVLLELGRAGGRAGRRPGGAGEGPARRVPPQLVPRAFSRREGPALRAPGRASSRSRSRSGAW